MYFLAPKGQGLRLLPCFGSYENSHHPWRILILTTSGGRIGAMR